MIRSLVLAAAIGAGALAAAPAPASARDVNIGVRVGGPGYYAPRPAYRPAYSYRYRAAPAYVYSRPAYRDDCRTVRRTYWHGHRKVVKTTRTCY